MRKKAIELSINYLVMLILAIAMFIIGILFLTNMFKDLIITKTTMEDQIKDEINRDMARNRISLSSKHIERGGYDKYYIGISNDLDYTDTFYIFVNCDFAVFRNGTILCDDGSPLSCSAFDSWVAFNPIGPFDIKQHGSDIQTIDMTVPKNAASGSYVYYVKVCTDNPCTDQYLTSKRLSVSVD